MRCKRISTPSPLQTRTRLGEKQKKDIEAQLANGTVDASEIEKLSSKFSFISNSIDEKTMRWLELQD